MALPPHKVTLEDRQIEMEMKRWGDTGKDE